MVHITEMRIVLPLTVEEFRRGQKYSNWKTNEDNTKDGQGGMLLSSSPYYHEVYGEGVFTHSLYQLGDRLPEWVTKLVPSSALVVDEKSWITFPYMRTIITIPFFSKLRIDIISNHLDDDGHSENAVNLSDDDLRIRQIDFFDIGLEKVAKRDYKKHLDPSLVKSKKTGRGPLNVGWKETTTPLMCAYKVVKAEANYWGFSTRAEKLMINGLRQIFLLAHKNCFCFLDDWFEMTFEQIAEMEMNTRQMMKEKKINKQILNIIEKEKEKEKGKEKENIREEGEGEGEGEGEEGEGGIGEENEDKMKDKQYSDEEFIDVEFFEAKMEWAAQEELAGENSILGIEMPISFPSFCPICKIKSNQINKIALFCQNCSEFFCDDCFKQFHITPRQKLHNFQKHYLDTFRTSAKPNEYSYGTQPATKAGQTKPNSNRFKLQFGPKTKPEIQPEVRSKPETSLELPPESRLGQIKSNLNQANSNPSPSPPPSPSPSPSSPSPSPSPSPSSSSTPYPYSNKIKSSGDNYLFTDSEIESNQNSTQIKSNTSVISMKDEDEDEDEDEVDFESEDKGEGEGEDESIKRSKLEKEKEKENEDGMKQTMSKNRINFPFYSSKSLSNLNDDVADSVAIQKWKKLKHLPLNLLEGSSNFPKIEMKEKKIIVDSGVELSRAMLTLMIEIYIKNEKILSKVVQSNPKFDEPKSKFDEQKSKFDEQKSKFDEQMSKFDEQKSKLDPYGINNYHDDANFYDYNDTFEILNVPSVSNLDEECKSKYEQYRFLSQKLIKIDSRKLTHDERLAFWMNIYNALCMHAYIHYGYPSTHYKRVMIMHKSSYVIGGFIFRLLCIEHNLLRRYSSKPALAALLPIEKYRVGDSRLAFSLFKSEPLINFALCCGSYSSPILQVYSSENVFNELEIAKKSFLKKYIIVNSASKKIFFPKILHWYSKDFGQNFESFVEWIMKHVDENKLQDMLCIIKMGQKNSKMMKVIPYNWNFRYLVHDRLFISGA